jgi:glutamine synthetase
MKQLSLSISNYQISNYQIAEYIWIDIKGKLRSKARTLYLQYTDNTIAVDMFPLWNFDGSSTGQASSQNSEVILKPVSIFRDPFRKQNGLLVLCECYDNKMNHLESNHRYHAQKIFDLVENHHTWFGLEQEYVLYDNECNRPLGWGKFGEPESQGKYYCGVGADRVFGRNIVEEHYLTCLEIGLQISGINAEVMPGQWEYQVGPVEGIDACDQFWIARYILERVCEKYNVKVSLDPKPVKGDWNGSGCHVNYSTAEMRSEGGLSKIYEAIEKLGAKHSEHIAVYGTNTERLIGRLETSSIDKFSYGVADRTASIRIPSATQIEGKGYLEDRRPASDIDPYIVLAKLVKTTLID